MIVVGNTETLGYTLLLLHQQRIEQRQEPLVPIIGYRPQAPDHSEPILRLLKEKPNTITYAQP